MSDLLQAAGYAAIVYLLFNYLISFGSGRPLVEWINPGRRYLPLLAVTLLGSAYGSLQYAVRRYQIGHYELLRDLVREEKAKPEIVGAVSFTIFAVAILMLGFWCWYHLPRAPQTFSPNPNDLIKEFRRCLRHYVRWKGGIDFAILCEIRNGELKIIAEGASDKSIVHGLNRLPGIHVSLESKNMLQDASAQKKIWIDTALTLFRKWPEFDTTLYPARHGKNIAMTFDLRIGAIFVEMIEEEPAPPGGDAVGVFLFAAALNQHEVNTLTAVKHFTLLSSAVRHIRTGVTKG